jgi:hypothetical protein
MVDDLSPARPQSGFSAASVVWHAPAEGGIPRYMMIFQETIPGEVGPVRSARLYYVLWAGEWKAVYAHAGGSPQALARLRRDGSGRLVYNADQFRIGEPEFWRVRGRFAPHNLYTNGKQLRGIARRVGAKDKAMKPAWNFRFDKPLVQRPKGGRIEVAYLANRIRYDYDRVTNSYLRSVTREGKQHDADTGERVAPKNVIVMLVRFGPLNDGSSKHRLEARLVGRGTAWIATNGRTIKGTWRKKSETAPTLFYDSKGREVVLTVGQTFVQVLPTGSRVTIKNGKVPPPPPTPQDIKAEYL